LVALAGTVGYTQFVDYDVLITVPRLLRRLFAHRDYEFWLGRRRWLAVPLSYLPRHVATVGCWSAKVPSDFYRGRPS
jgi:hypothetical protein